MSFVRRLTPFSEKTLAANEERPPKSFHVCDVESYKWMHLIVMGLTDGENFWEFGVSKEQYASTLTFKPFHNPPTWRITASPKGSRLTVWPGRRLYKPYLRKLPALPTDHPFIRAALDRFFEQLLQDGKSKDIYAHFGGKFDFSFLLNHLFFHTDYRVTGMIPRGSGLLCFDVTVDLGYAPSGHKREERKAELVRLSFHDSSAMLPFSLKSITKNFGVSAMKTDWDHRHSLPYMVPAMTEYNRTDCLGLHESIRKYREWPLIRRAGPAQTMAGQAMRVLRTMLDVEIDSLTPRVDAFVRKAYFGGRTEIFKPLFTGPGLLRCADVNSLYPTVMRDVPQVGNIPQEYPVKLKYFTYEYEPDSIGFYEAEVEVPDHLYVPPLGIVWPIVERGSHRKPAQKYVFPTGRFRGVFSTLELEYARTLGVKILKTDKGAVFQGGGNFFRKYVDELYHIRETSPRESVSNVLSKLLLNSCYGRFGLRTDREGLVIDEGQEGIIPLDDESGADASGYVLSSGERRVRLAKEPKELKTFNNVAVAAWVTSSARVFMHRHYMKITDSLYYTDTDSLFTTSEFPDSTGLGAMKIEYTCKGACFLLPKGYGVDGVEGEKFTKKIVLKGFDKQKTKNFTIEDLMLGLEGDLRRLRVVQEPKFATFKTALTRGRVLDMLPSSPRQVKQMYDKRIVEKVGGSLVYDTKPHKIIDHQPIVIEPQETLLGDLRGVEQLMDGEGFSLVVESGT